METKNSKPFDVLVLGGGFAGMYCTKTLAKKARKNPDFKVGIIAEENYMVFQPMLPSVASASISPRHVINPIRQLCKGASVFRGKVTAIDPDKKVVSVSAGDFTPNLSFSYKKLVVCLGAQVDLSRVPGMSEHSLLMQNVGDAMKLRAKLIERFEEANMVHDPKQKQKLLSFVVVGGGYSGVETAGEITDLMHEIHQYYESISKDDYQVTLIHSGDHLLPTLSKKLGLYCEQKLKKQGLTIELNNRVKAVTAESVVLQKGEKIASNTVISTVGNAPHPLVTKLAIDYELETYKGKLKTSSTLQVSEDGSIWAAGDCAAIPLNVSDDMCPATAQFAQRQGIVLANNLIAESVNKPLKQFKFKGLGELAAIGHRSAVAEIMGFAFSGFFAWWLWRSIYVSKLPGFQRKLRVIIDWTFDLFFPRDINLLSPQYSKPLKAIHLEPNDILFYPDEPAFSIYFVKEGKVLIKNGEDLIKAVGPGDYFGERALLEDRKYRFTAIAEESTELVALAALEFEAITEGSRDLRRLFERSAKSYNEEKAYAKLREILPKNILAQPITKVITRVADSIPYDLKINLALEQIQANPHGSYPVIKDGKFIGSLKRDAIYDLIKSEGIECDMTIENLNLQQLPQTTEDTTADSVLNIMNRSGKNKVIVNDANGNFKGLVTIVDFINYRAE